MEARREAEKVMLVGKATKEKEKEKRVQFMEQEIECPRCHGTMVLCSDFDSLYYVCEECDFYLYAIKRN